EARVEAIEREQAAEAATRREPEAPAPVVAAADGGYRPQKTFRDNETAELRPNNAPKDPSLKGFIAVPGTSALIKLGGYAETELIYDVDPIGTFDSFVTSAIPTNAPDSRRGSQFTAQAKQTRLDMDIQQDTPVG